MQKVWAKEHAPESSSSRETFCTPSQKLLVCSFADVSVKQTHRCVPHWFKHRREHQRILRITTSSSAVVIVSCALCSNAKAVQVTEVPSRTSFGYVSFAGHCFRSSRHGSRAGHEDIHLACQSSKKVSHIRDNYHIIIRRTKSKNMQNSNQHLKKGTEVNMFTHDH